MEKLQPGYCGDRWISTGQCYSVQKGYDWLRPELVDVNWKNLVWNGFALSKQAFIGWIVMHNRLMTNARLHRFGVTVALECNLCGDAFEDQEHIFFRCPYSSLCLQHISDWCRVDIPDQRTVIWWEHYHFRSKLHKKLIGAAILSLMYYVWINKNTSSKSR